MKKKVAKKKIPLKPAKKKSSKQETRDQYTVVLESLRSDFKVFGEALQMTHERMDRGFTEVNRRLDRLEGRMENVELKLAEHDTRIKQLELAITELIKELRDDKKQKEIDALKVRVATLEALIQKK